MRKVLLGSIVLSILLVYTGCDFAGDHAQVTVHISAPPEVAMPLPRESSFLDRVVSFLTFSSPVYADPAPDETWAITLTVESDAGDTDTYTLSTDSGATTISVPLGEVTFTVVAKGGVGQRYGAIVQRTITGSAEIEMQMGELPGDPSMNIASPNVDEVTLEWYPPGSGSWDGYILYRSTNENGPYSQIATITNYELNTYTDTNLPYTTYYYRIQAYNEFGYSNISTPISVVVDGGP